MNEQKEFICTVCPVGCAVKISENGAGGYSVEGNACKRGEKYAVGELTDPRRTVTSTVQADDGRMVSVKTKAPIPKSLVFDAVREIKLKGADELNKIKASGPVTVGRTLIKNIMGTGVDVVITSSL